jgi:hypothetical protein
MLDKCNYLFGVGISALDVLAQQQQQQLTHLQT